jgi:hypothetical protein
MRVGVFLGLACAAGWGAAGDAPAARYGVEADLKAYPQDTPKAALASVLKAAEAKQFEYLDAQLADPAFIDDRVQRLYGGDFAEQVKDTRDRLDPLTLKQLRRFLDDGDWTEDDMTASALLKDVPDRVVSLRKKDGRWFLENRSKPRS